MGLTVSDIQLLLTRHNLTPNIVMGQNFLVDEQILHDLIGAASIAPNDTILEAGGGLGTITEALAKRAKRVITVEKDKNFIPILNALAKKHSNIEVVEGDILKFNPSKYKMMNMGYKLVSNPPYYLTGRLFRTFLEENELKPSHITAIIQKEVAEKIIKKPPQMNLLSLSVQIFGSPSIVRTIPRNAFWPQPNIQSALLAIDIYQNPRIAGEQVKSLFRLAKTAFLHSRKQLKNTLPEDSLFQAGIDPTRRPQTLTIEEWVGLVDVV